MEKKTIVLGAPGSGKTVLHAWQAILSAQGDVVAVTGSPIDYMGVVPELVERGYDVRVISPSPHPLGRTFNPRARRDP